MENSNVEVKEKIKKEYLIIANEKRNIKITSGIDFFIDGDTVKMELSSNGVTSNMQDNIAAFEGWALILRRWGKYQHVTISWVKPDSINEGHYQRFLFRLKNFSQDFKSWFSIDKDCLPLLDDLKIKEGGSYSLNTPGKRSDKVSDNPEAILEDRFVNKDLREPLINISNAAIIDRQLPVGVFENKVSKRTSIFTRGKSAIDIWGINKSNELLVFELKAEGNKAVGIISELYFYVCVMQMVRKQKFVHKGCIDDNKHLLEIPKTEKIRAYFLTPSLHPLVDKEIVKLLNEANPKEMSYHYIQILVDVKLELDTFN